LIKSHVAVRNSSCQSHNKFSFWQRGFRSPELSHSNCEQNLWLTSLGSKRSYITMKSLHVNEILLPSMQLYYLFIDGNVTHLFRIAITGPDPKYHDFDSHKFTPLLLCQFSFIPTNSRNLCKLQTRRVFNKPTWSSDWIFSLPLFMTINSIYSSFKEPHCFDQSMGKNTSVGGWSCILIHYLVDFHKLIGLLPSLRANRLPMSGYDKCQRLANHI
jgi:hypothetical protein